MGLPSFRNARWGKVARLSKKAKMLAVTPSVVVGLSECVRCVLVKGMVGVERMCSV